MTSVLLQLAVAYLAGSVCGSLVLGRLRGVDIRGEGSGNAGGTNALRTQGLWFALGVVLIDVGKGVLAVTLVPQLAWGGDPALTLPARQALCGLAAVLGHLFPLYFGFRGGKGAATWFGTLLALSGPVVLGVLLTWIVVIVLSGYVGLATMLAAVASLPLALWLEGARLGEPLFTYCLVGSLVIVAAHHSNIRKMIAGTENRFEKVRITRWFGR